jgi:hypothetical protein
MNPRPHSTSHCLLLQLGDAGMAQLLPAAGASAHTSHIAGGTPGCIDPCYVATGIVGPKSDVYSLGEHSWDGTTTA